VCVPLSLENASELDFYFLELVDLLSDVHVNEVNLVHDEFDQLSDLLVAGEPAIVPPEVENEIRDSVLWRKRWG